MGYSEAYAVFNRISVGKSPNGDVEIVASGKAEKVDALLKWAEFGPAAAIVKNLTIELLDISSASFSSFEIRR